MANDFGLRVGVDGEREFKQALKELNASMKTLGSEAKLVASEFDENDRSTEALTAKSKVLTKQIEEQQKKIALLADGLENSKQKYGENSTQTLEWQRKLNDAQAEANKMQRELAKMNEEIKESTSAENAASRATGEYGDNLGEASKQAEGATSGTAELAATASSAAGVVVAAGTAIVGAYVKIGKAILDCTTSGGKYADTILTLAKTTGLSTDTLQELDYASELVDVSLDTITSTMRRNIMAMQNAQKGTEDYVKAYEALGVSIVDKNGKLRDSETVYWQLIDALGEVENLTERDALAMQIFGRSAQDLNPLILAGRDAMRDYAQEAHEMGYVLSEEVLTTYGELDDAQQRLEKGLTSAKNAIGLIFLPEIEALSSKGSYWLGEFSKAIEETNGDADEMVYALSNLLPQAADDMMEVLPDITRKVGEISVALAYAIGEKLPEMTKALATGMWDSVTGYFEGFFQRIGMMNELKNFLREHGAEDSALGQALGMYSVNGAWSSDGMTAKELITKQERTNTLLEMIAERDTRVVITDTMIGDANGRYNSDNGAQVTEGDYAHAR